MNLLAIDSTTEQASVALTAAGKLFFEEQKVQKQHAQCLLPMVERLLQQANLKINQLDGIAFGRGPGSFTGLRISCAIAKGLAYPYKFPLFPVSSLAAIVNEAVHNQPKLAHDQPILAVLDARMNQLYWNYYLGEAAKGCEAVSYAEEIEVPNSSLIIAGLGFEAYLAALPLATQATIQDQMVVYPHAKALVRLVLEGKISSVAAEEAQPVYIRNQVTQGEPRG